MLNLKTIMVPVDFSAASEEAVRYGVSLAIELDATLLLVHVVPFLAPVAYAYPFETRETRKSLADRVRAKLEALVSEEYRKAVHRRFVITSGDVKDEVLLLVADAKPDLVVMGTHGRRLFERWLLGSVAEHVLRHSPVPVLTVSRLDPEHEIDEPQPIPLRKILYATDLSESAGRALEAAYDLARKFSAELLVLHVMRPLEWSYSVEGLPVNLESSAAKIRDSLVAQLEASLPETMHADPRVRTVLVEGHPYEEILATAEEESVDLIVLNTQGKSGLDRALLGATAERIVRGAHVPVLSIPPEGTTPKVKPAAGSKTGGVLI